MFSNRGRDFRVNVQMAVGDIVVVFVSYRHKLALETWDYRIVREYADWQAQQSCGKNLTAVITSKSQIELLQGFVGLVGKANHTIF